MVGVPRSQGCRHCRRKKKGCDLQRPSCGQCLRLGLDCSYESKKWTFVQTDLSTIPIRSRSVPDLTEKRSASPPTGESEQSLQRRSAEICLLTEFWDKFLPIGEEPGIGGISAGYWSGVVRDLAVFDSAVNSCASACASTALGRYRCDPALLREGARMYSKALRETNQALRVPQRAQRDETLACVKLLSMYEALRFETSTGVTTQADDWHMHIAGTCRIVELRGPHKHVAHHGHLLFEEARLLAVISGIVLRKANYFTGPAWHTIPWETYPRDLRDELLDIMIALPDLLSKQDDLSESLKDLSSHDLLFSALTTAQTHLNRCIFIANSLREWENRALTACLASLTSTRPAKDFIGPLTLLEVCKDYNYGFFHLVNIYWVACTILYSSMWIIKRNVLLATSNAQQKHHQSLIEPAILPTLMHLPEIPTWATPRIAASNIAKCASHYFEEEAGFWGPWTSTFPIGTAFQYYAATGAHDSAEMKALQECFQRPKFGQSAAQFLRSMASSGSKKGDLADRTQFSALAGSWYGTDALERERTLG